MRCMQGAERGLPLPAVVAAVVGAVLLGLALVAAGETSRAEAQPNQVEHPATLAKPWTVNRLNRARCPAPYEARVRRDSYPRDDLQRARRWQFEIAGQVLRLKPPIDWRHDPVGSPAFRGRLQDLRWLDVLAYAHRQTGNRRPLRQAMRIAVDWVRENSGQPPTTDRTWFEGVAGDRASMLGYVVRAAACEGLIRRREARMLLGSAIQHGRFLSAEQIHTWTNLGLFADLGRLLLGRQVRFLPGAAHWRRGGERRFRRIARRLTFADEAFWLEHSTAYQFVSMNAIERFLNVPGIAPRQLPALLERMRQTAGLLVMPDRHWLQAGNSHRSRASPWANQQRRKQAGRMITKPRSGLAFVNHQRTYLAFLATFHSSIHKHSDDLSFDLFDQERRIVADTGMFHKDGDRFRVFQESAPAHSVLTVDRADFPRADAFAYGSGLRATGHNAPWFGIDATNPLLALQGVDHRRLLLYNRGLGVIVADALRSSERHVYRRYLQLGPTIRALEHPDGVELRDSDFRGHIHSATSAPAEAVRLVRGETDPLAGFIFSGFREREPRWTVELATEGGNVDHVTTLALDGDRLLRAELIGEIGATTSFALYRNEELYAILTVRRVDGRLVIETGEPPDDWN
jgi:hypothetical protein